MTVTTNERRNHATRDELAPGLTHVAGRPLASIGDDVVLAVLKARNEAWRLPFWLAYHRWIGVDHFVVFDNQSTDATEDLLAGCDDVTLINASGEFRGPRGYREWIRIVLRSSPPGRWHLILDADELFVAAPWRRGGLRTTLSALDAENADVASALMVDCYPESFASEGTVAATVPWLRAPWFDPGPYGRWRPWRRKVSPKYAGVRERLFWPNWRFQKWLPRFLRKKLKIESPPYIVKWPLLKHSSASLRGLHETHSRHRPSSYFNLLHYKFDVDFLRKIQTATQEGQYYRASAEYKKYAATLVDGGLQIRTAGSLRFSGLASLQSARLCRYSRQFLARAGADGPLDTDIDKALAEIAEFAGGGAAWANGSLAPVSRPQ